MNDWDRLTMVQEHCDDMLRYALTEQMVRQAFRQENGIAASAAGCCAGWAASSPPSAHACRRRTALRRRRPPCAPLTPGRLSRHRQGWPQRESGR